MELKVNSKTYEVDAPSDMPILWVLRDILGMTGTKFGCGMGLCGACTVHLNGNPIRSCSTPVIAAQGSHITTIEGLEANPAGRAVQEAWANLDVVQCGYCQSGQIMSASALVAQNNNPSDDEIDQFMAGNLCRCGTYQRIKEGVREAAKTARKAGGK